MEGRNWAAVKGAVAASLAKELPVVDDLGRVIVAAVGVSAAASPEEVVGWEVGAASGGLRCVSEAVDSATERAEADGERDDTDVASPVRICEAVGFGGRWPSLVERVVLVVVVVVAKPVWAPSEVVAAAPEEGMEDVDGDD
jgi:hypothetical protein